MIVILKLEREMDFSSKPSFNECCPDCKNNKRLFQKIGKKFKEMFIDFNILSLHFEDSDDDDYEEYDVFSNMDKR